VILSPHKNVICSLVVYMHGQKPYAGPCGHHTEFPSSINMKEFFTSQVITTPASQKNSPSWSHSLTLQNKATILYKNIN